MDEQQAKDSTGGTPRKFYRSQKDRVLAGVCGGLARYFEIDPVLMRVIFIALTLFHGIGLITYIILALIVPNENLEKPEAIREESVAPESTPCCGGSKSCYSGRHFVAALLIIAGGLLLMEQLLPGFYIRWDLMLPAGLILFGLSLFLK